MSDQPRPSLHPENRRVVATFDTLRRRWPGTDAHMSAGEGCLDCFVGEPHTCSLLVWDSLVVTEDEFGSCAVDEVSTPC